jgi:thymidylate kinase
MDENLKSRLTNLISDLYFMSESEYPFTIEELHEKDFSQIEKNILSKYEPQSKLIRIETTDFFNRIINNFEIAEDELSQSFAKKYKELYQFIIQACKSSLVLKCGKIEVGVFIILEFKNGSFTSLKTISVET